MAVETFMNAVKKVPAPTNIRTQFDNYKKNVEKVTDKIDEARRTITEVTTKVNSSIDSVFSGQVSLCTWVRLRGKGKSRCTIFYQRTLTLIQVCLSSESRLCFLIKVSIYYV